MARNAALTSFRTLSWVNACPEKKGNTPPIHKDGKKLHRYNEEGKKRE